VISIGKNVGLRETVPDPSFQFESPSPARFNPGQAYA
jgi:hypothetical protein